jgi:ATP-dependent helicase Lhr and Lhr-like helicase
VADRDRRRVTQFAVPGAVDRLRAFRESPPVPDVVVLAATDPANAYGVALPWPVKGPQRAAGAYVVLVDGLPSLYLEKGGKSVVGLRTFDGEWEEHAVKAVGAMVGPEQDRTARFRRLVLERLPDELRPFFVAQGFVPTPKGLARYE